ncbi:hypothetical protein HDU96_009232 [Phlyctochytrium bullatum]|nr:hypothetical protein HDU96_009232 [Phlyctochytrium bullatum]
MESFFSLCTKRRNPVFGGRLQEMPDNDDVDDLRSGFSAAAPTVGPDAEQGPATETYALNFDQVFARWFPRKQGVRRLGEPLVKALALQAYLLFLALASVLPWWPVVWGWTWAATTVLRKHPGVDVGAFMYLMGQWWSVVQEANWIGFTAKGWYGVLVYVCFLVPFFTVMSWPVLLVPLSGSWMRITVFVYAGLTRLLHATLVVVTVTDGFKPTVFFDKLATTKDKIHERGAEAFARGVVICRLKDSWSHMLSDLTHQHLFGSTGFFLQSGMMYISQMSMFAAMALGIVTPWVQVLVSAHSTDHVSGVDRDQKGGREKKVAAADVGDDGKAQGVGEPPAVGKQDVADVVVDVKVLPPPDPKPPNPAPPSHLAPYDVPRASEAALAIPLGSSPFTSSATRQPTDIVSAGRVARRARTVAAAVKRKFRRFQAETRNDAAYAHYCATVCALVVALLVAPGDGATSMLFVGNPGAAQAHVVWWHKVGLAGGLLGAQVVVEAAMVMVEHAWGIPLGSVPMLNDVRFYNCGTTFLMESSALIAGLNRYFDGNFG